MPENNPVKLEIAHGANKEALLRQLSDIGRMEMEDRPVFGITVYHATDPTMATRYEVGILILGLTAESGSGNTWNFVGDLTTAYVRPNSWLDRLIQDMPSHSIHGFYNSQTRKGWLKFGR